MTQPWWLIAVALSVAGLLCLCRALGFGEGVVLGATPASAVALAAAVVLRWRGALAAASGYLAVGLAWGLPAETALAAAAAPGLAALLAAIAMRSLARRRAAKSKTSDWLISLVGLVLFTGIVTATLVSADLALDLSAARRMLLLPAVFEPLGIMTFGAVIASLPELRRIAADPAPAAGIALLGITLLGALWLLLDLSLVGGSPSGVTLLLSLPFCLWIAMQRRSLDGAALSFVAAHIVLLMLLGHTGSVNHGEFVTAVLYLDLLVATCQLVHAVNLDRLLALAEVEESKRELEKRVLERTAKLTAMTEKAMAADAAKMAFMATVSHEVRTPLSGVIGIANLVLAEPTDERTRRHVEIIRTSGYHLLDIINRILDFAKINHPLGPADMVEVDLRGIVEEVVQEASFLPYAAGVAFRSELELGLSPHRRGYRQGLRQILTNLVGNAAKFTRDGGRVTVRMLDRGRDTIRLEVEDTGVGIPPSLHERIFLPFEQVDESVTHQRGGTGLGLAICAEVVRRMGGRIGVESQLGVGSLFWVELPLPAAPRAAGARPAAAVGS